MTLSQLWDKYGISLFNHSGAFDITFIYLYGTGSFYLANTGLSTEWNFGSGTVTVNGTDYAFSMYTLEGKNALNGAYWLPNVTYNFGDDFNAAVSVDQYGTVTKEMWEQFLYVFEPHTSYQTQTIPTAYSVVYDTATDSLKIGYGYYNKAGEYILYNELSDSITTRADSSELTDGHILKWDSVKNRLVDSGKGSDDISTVSASNEGTATETIKYITINGVEYKVAYDPLIIEEEHTVSEWTALANSQPFFYSTTVTITQPLQEKTYVSLKNDDPVFFANFGLVIASIEGQTATIYATNLPADNTKITFILEN